MSFFAYFSYIKKIDWLLLLPVILLIVLGLATLYTTNLNIENPDWSSLQKQLLFFILGLFILIFFGFFDYRRLGSYSWPLYIFSVILLIVVLLWGRTIRGTTGWFSFLGFNFQPVELAKFSLVLVLSFFYSRRRGREKESQNVFSLAIITAYPLFSRCSSQTSAQPPCFWALGFAILFF